MLLSCAPVQGHIAGLVDVGATFYAFPHGSETNRKQLPNACTTLGLPMDIFDFDISPTGPAKKMDMGSCAFTSK